MSLEKEIIEFQSHKRKGEDTFKIMEIDHKQAYEFVTKYHYLGNKRFLTHVGVGLFFKDELVGVATYCTPSGLKTLQGWFNVDNKDTSILELSRLCLRPDLNQCNATSYLLGRSIRLLKNNYNIRAVITLADAVRHVGKVYQVCNFKYYGLTDKKTDFYCYVDDDHFKKSPRGSTKDKDGVWLQRNRKHRYLYLIDKNLKCLYTEEVLPEYNIDLINEEAKNTLCCSGSNVVYDNRFKVKYSCPKCTGKLIKDC